MKKGLAFSTGQVFTWPVILLFYLKAAQKYVWGIRFPDASALLCNMKSSHNSPYHNSFHLGQFSQRGYKAKITYLYHRVIILPKDQELGLWFLTEKTLHILRRLFTYVMFYNNKSTLQFNWIAFSVTEFVLCFKNELFFT